MQERASQGAAAPASSFSLFDPNMLLLHATPRVSMDDVRGAASDKERLVLLRTVAHVEDVHMDWEELRPYLLRGLASDAEYLHLLRTWFEQCQSSTEYAELQYDICKMVLQVCVERLSSKKEMNATTMGDLIPYLRSCRHLWTSTMLHGQYSEQAAARMEGVVLRMVSLRDGSVLPIHILSAVDPRATWFTSWARQIQPRRLAGLSRRFGLVAMIDLQNPSSVCMLHAILTKTRVALFPWAQIHARMPPPAVNLVELKQEATKLNDFNAVGESSQDENLSAADLGDASTQRAIEKVLNLFLGHLLTEDTDEDTTFWDCVCADAVGTILWGCKNDNPDFFTSLVGTVRERVSKFQASGAKDPKQQAVDVLLEALDDVTR